MSSLHNCRRRRMHACAPARMCQSSAPVSRQQARDPSGMGACHVGVLYDIVVHLCTPNSRPSLEACASDASPMCHSHSTPTAAQQQEMVNRHCTMMYTRMVRYTREVSPAPPPHYTNVLPCTCPLFCRYLLSRCCFYSVRDII